MKSTPKKIPDLRVQIAGAYGTPGAIAEANPEVGTENSVRYDIKFRDQNGLAQADAIRRIGGRYLINAEKYIAWKFSRAK